jgi:hypothetical protein
VSGLVADLTAKLVKASNLSDLVSATTARANLGLGTVTPVAGVGNGSTDDRAAIAAADTTAVATGLSALLPSGTYRVASNLTVASPLIMQAGAVIKPDSGVTVTLAGGVDAPRKQVFDHSAGGVVAPKKVDYYHPAWWGATGGSDDTAAWTGMAAAITASKVNDATTSVDFGQRILAPAGVNRFFGVTLSNCHLVADKGVSIFYPSGTPTSGSMLTTGDYTTITGGYWRTNGSGQAINLIKYQGYRSLVEKVYMVPTAASSVALYIDGTGGSITPVLRDIQIHSGSASGGTGIYLISSDAQMANVWIGPCSIGINFQRPAARISNLHVWGCGTGLSGSPDDTEITGLYLDSNAGWGIDWTSADRNTISNFHAWQNGAVTGSTGGIRILKSGGSSCSNNLLSNGVFDDNTGIGLLIDGATGTEVTGVRIASRSVDNSGGAAVCATGIRVASTSTNTRLQVRGLSSAVTTTLIDDLAASTSIDLLTIRKVLTSDQTFTSTTALATLLSIPVGTSEKWLIDGVLICDGGQTGDAKFRMQATSATGATGYASFTVGPAASSTSTTAVSANPITTFAIATSAGSATTVGTVGTGSLQSVVVSGYLATSTTAGTLELQAAQNTSDATALTVRAGSWMRATRIA